MGGTTSSGANGMSDHNSSYCSLGANLSPSPGQVGPLKLAWSNPNKKQSRKKYWANLKLVWDAKRGGRRKAA